MKDLAHPAVISALEDAADHIEENPSNYMWTDSRSCICGHVVRQLLDLKVENMPKSGCWKLSWGAYDSYENENRCEDTDLSLPYIFQQLKKYGFDRKSIGRLEQTRHPRVLESMGKMSCDHFDWEETVEYLRKFADLLREDLAD